jgi:peptidoglycan/xylan/chitin deacetylase (PgdA/CDA1 family)
MGDGVMFHLRCIGTICITLSLFFAGCQTGTAQQKNQVEQQEQKQYAAQKENAAEEQKQVAEMKHLTQILKQPIVLNGPRTKKEIALTFDDGPDDVYTYQVLKILKKEGIRATFFVIGNQAKAYPHVVRQIMEEGHVLANHSWRHAYLPKLTPAQLKKDLAHTNQAVFEATGKNMLLLRPPYGAAENITNQMKSWNYTIVNWDVDTNDWQKGRTADQIYHAVIKNAQNGSITLQHNGGGDRSATVKALPRIIKDLKKKGFKFVTLDEMLKVPAYSN